MRRYDDEGRLASERLTLEHPFGPPTSRQTTWTWRGRCAARVETDDALFAQHRLTIVDTRCDGHDQPIEVETYTWGVLPRENVTGPLPDLIAREIRWAEECLQRGAR